MPNDDPLRLAQDHVGTAERLVAEQKARIQRLKAKGEDALEAEQTLALFEVNLNMFREHRDSLLRLNRSG
jgi:hypothetical protein